MHANSRGSFMSQDQEISFGPMLKSDLEVIFDGDVQANKSDIGRKNKKKKRSSQKSPLDLSHLGEFSGEHKIISSFSDFIPERIIVGGTYCSFSAIVRKEAFFRLMIFHSINCFFHNVLTVKGPFKINYEKKEEALTGVSAYFQSFEKGTTEVLEHIAPIILKNYYLFGKEDILYKNRKKIRDMRKNRTESFFLNADGHLVKVREFVMENEQAIKEKLSKIIAKWHAKLLAEDIDGWKQQQAEDDALYNLRGQIFSAMPAPAPVREDSKTFDFIDKSHIERIEKEGEEAQRGDAEESRLNVIKKNNHIKNGVGLVTASQNMLAELEGVKERFPNFSEIVDFLKGSISLSLLERDTELTFDPFLMLGGPGLGKTAFAKEVGRALGLPTDLWTVSQLNQGFTITGLDMGWASGKPGKIFTSITNNSVGNPVIVLDELDKARDQISNGGAISSIFLQLFEKETAKAITDEALDVPMDASYMNWICTANDASEISQPLLSRLKVFTVHRPKEKDMPAVIDSIYSKLLSEQSNGHCFALELPERFHRELKEFEPRKVNKILKDCMMYCAQSAITNDGSRDNIVLDEVNLNRAIENEPRQRHKNTA